MSSTTKSNGKRKNANRNRRKNKAARKRAAAVPASPTFVRGALSIAPCTRAYMKALVDPFRVKVQPCIPDLIILPSNKFGCRATGVFSTGTAGTGFVVFDPWKMSANDNAGTNNNYPVLFTDTTYARTDITYATGTAGVARANSNSPYTSAFLTDRKQFRLVAAGVKIQYTGSNFRNQGRVALFRTQTNRSIATGTTFAQLAQAEYTAIRPVSRKEEFIYYTPDASVYLSYSDTNDFYNTAGGVDHYAYAVMIDGGDTTTPQSWTWEAHAHFEVIGPNLPLTKSDGDATGFTQVLASLDTKAPQNSPLEESNALFSRFKNGFMDSATQIVYQAGAAVLPAALGMASNLMSGPRSMGVPTITDV